MVQKSKKPNYNYLEHLKNMVKELIQRIKLLFGTGIVTRAEANVVQLRLATGITNDKIKRVQNYGFISHVLPESKAYTLFVGGDTSLGIAVVIEDERHEIELKPGEVAMIDDKGNLIHFTDNGIKIKTEKNVEIEAAGDVKITCQNATINATKTTINSETEINGITAINGETTITGDTTINGNTTVTGICAVGGLTATTGGAVSATGGMAMTGGDIEVDGISVKTHTHPETGTGGGTTGGPQ